MTDTQNKSEGNRMISSSLIPPTSSLRSRRSRRGFSFAEVMFAVVILGIGFIMVAAIFPVSISQTETSVGESAGVSSGYAGVVYLQKLMGQKDIGAMLPAPYGNSLDGIIHPIDVDGPVAPASRWNRLRGNFINSADPRFAWIPIGYKGVAPTVVPGSANPPAFVEVFVLAVQARNRPTFDLDDLTDNPTGTPNANLRPKTVNGVDIQDQNPTYGVDTASFAIGTDTMIASGAFILVADDGLGGGGFFNGHYYRIGNKLAETSKSIWELQPGHDFTPEQLPGADGIYGTADDPAITTQLPNAQVLVVGRGYADPKNPTAGTEEGPAMDLFMLPPIVVSIPAN